MGVNHNLRLGTQTTVESNKAETISADSFAIKVEADIVTLRGKCGQQYQLTSDNWKRLNKKVKTAIAESKVDR